MFTDTCAPCSSKDLPAFLDIYKEGKYGIKPKEKEEDDTNKQIIIEKENEIKQTLQDIDQGLKDMEVTKTQNIELIRKEFDDLMKKLESRRDTIITQMTEIKNDKKAILTKQADQLRLYAKELQEERKKDAEDIDITLTEQKVDIVTKPEILLTIDNDKLSKIIGSMGDVNNTFPPNPPRIMIDEVKAHTCKINLLPAIDQYDGFQKPSTHVIEIAFGPNKGKPSNDDEKEVDFEKLKWKEIARKENASFVRIKKLKPSTVYYVKAKCKNEYGWSEYSKPAKLETYVLKINTKIMTSDEIQILIDLIKEKRKKVWSFIIDPCTQFILSIFSEISELYSEILISDISEWRNSENY